MDDWKEQWMLLSAELRELEEHRQRLLAPTQAAYDRLQERLDEIEDDKGWVRACEGCSRPICDDDPKASCYDAGDLCVECAPCYSDVLSSPSMFANAVGEPMSDEDAKAFVSAHIKTGGSLKDKVVFPQMINGTVK
jgi:hypothetical protein